jgi:anti-sigma regulatory factor (Ser/Thr protein kinase)
MEVIEQLPVRIADESGPGEARRVGTALARSAGLSEVDVGRLGIVVTEAATNLVKHGGGGEILLRALRHARSIGVGLLALDRGPGIADLGRALRDGFSSAGSPGTGLGAIRRLASSFDLYSRPGEGTALHATVWSSPPAPPGLRIGGINVPCPGEAVSGDGWVATERAGGALVLLADGLGHGAGAAEASTLAADVFRRHAALSPVAALDRIHAALRPTRGAAVAVVEIDSANGLVRFAGIGNIAGTILADGASRSVVSHHGTAGHVARRIEEFTYPWRRGALLVLHSDGLTSHWSLDRYPGLAGRDPTLIAAVLYRDFRRTRDDTSVVVVREDA